MAKIIKAIRSDQNGDGSDQNGHGEQKTPCAEFHITVYETGDYDKVQVQVESSDAITIDQVCACAYFLWLTAENCSEANSDLDVDQAMLFLCSEAKQYENKIIAMPRRE